jgi:hypothetical protein
MRSLIVNVLPARARLQVEITPALAADEVPVIMSSRGAGAVLIEQQSPTTFVLANQLDTTSPTVFFVEARSRVESAAFIARAYTMLKGTP